MWLAAVGLIRLSLDGFDDTVMPVSHFPPDITNWMETRVALTEQQRAEIYNSLADKIGQQEAEFLMAQQPLGGWEQLATKRDLADLETKTQAGFVALNAKMDVQFAQLREQLAEQFASVDSRFAELSDKRSRDVWGFVVATVSICGSVFLAAWQFAPA